jgi:hypothetical protein
MSKVSSAIINRVNMGECEALSRIIRPDFPLSVAKAQVTIDAAISKPEEVQCSE